MNGAGGTTHDRSDDTGRAYLHVSSVKMFMLLDPEQN